MEMNDKHDKKDLLKFLKDIKRVLDSTDWELSLYTTEKRKRILIDFSEKKVEQLDRIIENFERYYGNER
jgi:hypothetical protein